MHKIIRSLKSTQPSPAFARKDAFRRPHYDYQEQMDALKLTVYVPGVDSAGIDIEVRGPDLIVTAPKSHLVRANWRAAPGPKIRWPPACCCWIAFFRSPFRRRWCPGCT